MNKHLIYFIQKRRAKYFAKDWKSKHSQDFVRFQNCNSRKASRQIKKEISILYQYWGCYPFQYFRFNMYRKDCILSIDEMKKYVPVFFSHNLYLPSIYKEYSIICDNKLLCYHLLKGYNLPQATFLFSCSDRRFYGMDNCIMSSQKVDAIIADCMVNRIFIKPTGGMGGSGIFVFDKNSTGQYINKSDEFLNAEFLVNKLGKAPYIIQEGVEQANEINVIYPNSINTLRIVTHYNQGKARLLLSFMRIGYGGKAVDNVGEGGLIIKIDLETGKLGEKALSPNFDEFTQHPDTQFLFSKYQIPFWKEVNDLVLNAAVKFRNISYLGWDIALSKSGPLIIEVNKDFSFNGIQTFYGGARDMLGIGDPKKWWYTKGLL